MVEVSVVIVCMNRPDLLFPCLDSIKVHTSVSFECWVVAYMFSTENLAQLREKYPWVQVVESEELRGFSENNNLAQQRAKGRYCFIVNDDTLLAEPVVDLLVKDLEKLPENAAAVSPCIRFADGRIQTCGRTRWTPWRYAKHYLHLVDESLPEVAFRPTAEENYFSKGFAKNHFSPAYAMPAHEGGLFRTYTLNGACFLIKTEAFKKVGWFDERYFFTPEDIALGHVLNEAGYTVWADASVNITHLAGGSVSALEHAIKPARVRGSLIFYREPLWLKCFIWSVELARYVKNALIPGKARALRKKTALNVMHTVFSHKTPKEIFMQFKP